MTIFGTISIACRSSPRKTTSSSRRRCQMGQRLCEGAPWCLLPVMDGQDACVLHAELPAKKLFNEEGGLCTVESAEEWKVRWRRHQKAKRNAAAKAAESDAKGAERGEPSRYASR